MKKKKIRHKTPAKIHWLAAGIKDEGSDFFWQFTDAQIEKIGRKLEKEFNSRMDEYGYLFDWWAQEPDSMRKQEFKIVKEAFEIHSMQRIFMDEEHVEKWEPEPGPKGKFEWLNDDKEVQTT